MPLERKCFCPLLRGFLAGAVAITISASLAAASAGEIAAAAGPGGVSIDRQPFDIRATEGGPAYLSVVAQGTAPLTYQWRRGDQVLANDSRTTGAASPVLVINPVLRADASNYSVVVTAGGSAVTSSVISLSVTQLFVPPPVPLGTTGALISVFGLPGDVYRVESRVDFGSWVTNGFATNVSGRAEYRDFYTGGGFRQIRVGYERLLPVLHSPRIGTGAIPVYGMAGERWRLRSSPDLRTWTDVTTVSNETGWVFFTNNAVTPARFYLVAPPAF